MIRCEGAGFYIGQGVGERGGAGRASCFCGSTSSCGMNQLAAVIEAEGMARVGEEEGRQQ